MTPSASEFRLQACPSARFRRCATACRRNGVEGSADVHDAFTNCLGPFDACDAASLEDGPWTPRAPVARQRNTGTKGNRLNVRYPCIHTLRRNHEWL